MRTNPCLEAVTAELDRAGLRYAVHSNGHVHVTWQHGELRRRVVMSATPSSSRARWNARSDVRRILRQDGLIGARAVMSRKYAALLVRAQSIEQGREGKRMET
jgi:hypothetical protein